MGNAGGGSSKEWEVGEIHVGENYATIHNISQIIKKGLNEEVKKSSSSRHARYRKQETWTSLFPCLFGERKRDSSSLVYVRHQNLQVGIFKSQSCKDGKEMYKKT